MTAETDLLPLPPLGECSEDSVQEWGRANVEAATEALRAEVAEWKRIASAQAKLHGEAEVHAERLAEALRMFLQAGVGNSTDFYVQYYATIAARAALEQEGGNG